MEGGNCAGPVAVRYVDNAGGQVNDTARFRSPESQLADGHFVCGAVRAREEDVVSVPVHCVGPGLQRRVRVRKWIEECVAGRRCEVAVGVVSVSKGAPV
jgi:hypothetical protein